MSEGRSVRTSYLMEPSDDLVQDLQVLSDSNREIASTYSTEDPLVSNEKYGTILNPNVKVQALLYVTCHWMYG